MVIENIALLVEVFAVIWCIHLCYGEKIKCDWKTLALVIIDIVIMNLIDSGYIPSAVNGAIYIIIVVYCIVEFDFDLEKVIVNNIIYFVMLGTLQMLGFFCASLLGIYISFSQNILALISNIFMIGILKLVSGYIDLHKVSNYLCSKEILSYIVLIFASVALFTCLYLFKKLCGMYLGEYILLCISLIIMLVVTVSWGKYKARTKESEAELQAYRMYESSYKNLITEIRIKQHEFNNHINAIYNMSNIYFTYDELIANQKQYCNHVVNDNKYERLLKVGNSVLIGFLYGKLLEAEGRGIDVDYDVQCMELNVGLPMYKLVELIGNLLNNAMDACENRVNETRKIKISIIENINGLKVVIANVSEYVSPETIVKMFEKGYSSKKGEHRGIGLYAIKRMSKVYNFDIICNNEQYEDENWLVFSVNIKKNHAGKMLA